MNKIKIYKRYYKRCTSDEGKDRIIKNAWENLTTEKWDLFVKFINKDNE